MKKILFIAFVGLALAGCGNFLDEQSQSEVIPKTTADFAELLLGAGYPSNGPTEGTYPRFTETYYLDDDCSFFLTHGLWPLPGNPVMVDSRVGGMSAVTELYRYTWQPRMMDINGYGENINTNAGATTYGSFYNRIVGCNAVLDLLDGSIGTQAEKDKVRAEALALRAFYYFWLVNLYGEPYNSDGGKESLGVPVKLNADLSDDPMPRSTVGDIYDNVIVPDLVEAARLLDQIPLYRKNYHINQPALHILLSRVYLYMDRFADCLAEIAKAEAYDIRLLDYTNSTAMGVLGASNNIITYSNPEVEWLYGSSPVPDNEAYRPGQGRTSGNTVGIWNLFDDKVNDTRWTLFAFQPVTSGDAPSYDIFMSKPRGSNLAGSMAVRASEAWLNKAEAQALSGLSAPAAATITEFIAKRYNTPPAVPAGGNELLQFIRNERRRELCYEGHRWFDLRRQGMPAIEHRYKVAKRGIETVYTLNAKDEMYTLPFPNSVIANNSSTEVVMEQNPSRNIPERIGVTVAQN